jgi:hypothetical protein
MVETNYQDVDMGSYVWMKNRVVLTCGCYFDFELVDESLHKNLVKSFEGKLCDLHAARRGQK